MSADFEALSKLLTALGGERFDPLKRMKDGETPPSITYAAAHAGHQMRIQQRKEREANAYRIFGRRNIGHVTPR